MSGLTRNVLIFVLAYLAGMAPTYVLPYFGSNSAIVNAIGAGLGLGMTPQWWAHMWCLAMLVLLAHARSRWNHRGYLAVFPLIAAAFDMVPGLSLVPLVPTVMHLLALVLGATGQAPQVAGDSEEPVAPASRASMVAGLVTVVAVAGSLWSLLALSSLGRNSPRQAVSSPAARPAPAADRSASSAATAAIASRLQSPSVAQPPPAIEPAKPMQQAPRVTTARSTRPATTRAAEPDHNAIQSGKTQPQAEPSKRVRYINLNDP